MKEVAQACIAKLFEDCIKLLINGLLVYISWNTVMTKFNWPTLTYIECMALLVLIIQICDYFSITVKIKEMPEKT
jgi:hypothetical protein